MEFRFNLSSIFTNPIIKINSNLLPANFRGDRRTALETTTKMAEIINTMGECSAKAQGLNKPVTTAQKLRQSDQNLYLLGDPNAGKNGAVLGLLKVGKKTLYVFDNNGDTQTVNAPCVLDFYVHESRQRSGLGKTLFEMMLKEENFLPKKLAIDRPSDKLLGFLKKHYGLHKSIPQMNNFVIYEGFFDDTNNTTANNNQEKTNNRVEITASPPKHYTTGPCYYSPNTALFGTQFGSEEYKRNKQQCAASNIQTIQNTPVGRYAAPRPACSMAEVFNTTDSVLQNNQNQNNNFNIQQISPQAQSVNQSQQQTYQNIGTTNGMYQVPQNSQNQMPQIMNNFQSVPQVTQQQFNQMNSQQPILQNTSPQCMFQPTIHTQNQLQIQNTSSPIMSQQPIAQMTTQPVNQVPLNQSAPPELMQQMNFQSMNPMGSQPIPNQGMTQAISQPIVQSLTQPITQSMPQSMSQAMPQSMSQAMPQTMSQAMPQSMVQSAPQIMAQAMSQQVGPTYPQQIVQAQQQQQQQQFMQPMTNPPQQVFDQSNISAQNNGMNNKNEETSTQRRFKANGLSEDPQKSTYVPSTQLQYVQPAGKPSGLNRNKQNNLSPSVSTSNNSYVRRPMQQQQPNQPVFQQNQVGGTINQNPDQKNAMDLNPKMSSASLKSRRFKADGLSEDPQRVIHTSKTEVFKMQPAGKPSGMYYSNKSSLGVSSSITSMQNIPTSSYQNKMNEIQQPNAMMLTSNASPAQNINNQYSQPPNDQIQMQNLQMVNASQASVNPMQGVQMVPSSQMIPQTIIPQVNNSQMIVNQVANPQVFANQATVAQDINNVQAVNNIPVPEGQNINGQAFSAPINNVPQSQMQNVQPINQIVNPQVMNNQMMNSQVINSQAINTQAVATNNQQFVNNQMGDYQMKTNPTDNLSLQMQNPQIINTLNPSEPLQIQNNMNEANKVMNNMPVAIIHSTTASAKGELKRNL